METVLVLGVLGVLRGSLWSLGSFQEPCFLLTLNIRKIMSPSWWNSCEYSMFYDNLLQTYCVDFMWLGLSVWAWTLPQVPAPRVRRTLVPTWASASSSGRITPAIAPWPPTLAHSATTVSYCVDGTNRALESQDGLSWFKCTQISQCRLKGRSLINKHLFIDERSVHWNKWNT